MHPTGLGQLHDILKQNLVAVNLRNAILNVQNLVGREQLTDLARRMAVQLQHGDLASMARIAHLDAQQKAVELRFR